MDYEAKIKASLLLPRTEFPMRADLPKREPAFLALWSKKDAQGKDLYDHLVESRREMATERSQVFILHDGPPFANGDAHMGHALNKILKDLVLKFNNMSGRYAPYIPGWDCHGLPIEFKVMKEAALPGGSSPGPTELDAVEIRQRCEATARHFVEVQKTQFRRLGIFGDWSHPYLTMDPAYEAETLRVLATLVERDLVYQGLRPVHWSTGCQTALAEAEIEYKERVDPAIFVAFPLELTSDQATDERIAPLLGASLLIWTTTPWTLPANLGVAISPSLEYSLVSLAGKNYLVHAPLLAKIPGGSEAKLLGLAWPGHELIGLTYRHPFLADGRVRRIYGGDFVTAGAGSGLVHLAPGHGQDDYLLGQQNGLPVFAPVDDRGCLTEACGVASLVGQYVFKANPLIIELLEEKGLLVAQEDYRHDYPHCWRSKTPIIFRAVKQWFIKVDTFRSTALQEIERVDFVPPSGRNRIRGAVEARPDWCISRQRTWGIPLPVFYDEEGEPVLESALIRAFADLVEKEGTGIWFSRSTEDLAQELGLAEVLKKTGAGGGNHREWSRGWKKGRDTLDVWIDSGTSWKAVVQTRPELAPFAPADLYLEGSDQHRGWFQSSLLTSVAATGKAPYASVLTNGFVVDLEGKKLSKSGTGYQKPVDLQSLVDEQGADVLRLWVASQDYQDDTPFSNTIFARVADSYRSIRNTLRILLGNLSGFNPRLDSLPKLEWTPIDAYFFAAFQEMSRRVLSHYAAYEFSQVYQTLNRFVTVDLSAQYIDILKDRLYCDGRKSRARRSSQTVLHEILTSLVRLLAPVLPYTAEEAWQYARELEKPGSNEESLLKFGHRQSVHFQLFPKVSGDESSQEAALLTQGKNWLQLRSLVNEKVEALRREKVVGKSLEAVVEIETNQPALLETDPSFLAEILLVSQVKVTPCSGRHGSDCFNITVAAAKEQGLQKCVRCWKFFPALNQKIEASTGKSFPLCLRCEEVLEGELV